MAQVQVQDVADHLRALESTIIDSVQEQIPNSLIAELSLGDADEDAPNIVDKLKNHIEMDDLIAEAIAGSEMFCTSKSRRLIEIAHSGDIRDLYEALGQAREMADDQLHSFFFENLAHAKELVAGSVIGWVNQEFAGNILMATMRVRMDAWLANLEDHIDWKERKWRGR